MESKNSTAFPHYDYTPSETESTVSSQAIHTPTSEDMKSSDEIDYRIDMSRAEEEQAPLLEEKPPQYERVILGMPTDTKDGDNDGEQQAMDPDQGKRKKCGKCCKGKKKCGRRFVKVFFRGLLCFGLFFWLYKLVFGGLGLSRHFSCPGKGSNIQREITIHNDHQNIHGRYPLFDLLSLSTTSGDIRVSVVPQPADPATPDEPARLRIRSTSGSVTVSFALPAAASVPEVELSMKVDEVRKIMTKGEEEDDEARQGRGRSKKQKTKRRNGNKLTHKAGCTNKGFFKLTNACKEHKREKRSQEENLNPNHHHHHHQPESLPLRPYEIEIETDSGSIAGRFLVSSSLNLTTGSGSISSLLVPVVGSHNQSNVSVTTRTDSGSQQIHFTEPFRTEGSSSHDDKSDEISHASHTSHRGSMQISYPHQWAGKIQAQSEGSVIVAGKDVQIIHQENGLVEGVKDADADAQSWWGSSMDVALRSEGAILFHVA